jgi:hypothetical protein
MKRMVMLLILSAPAWGQADLNELDEIMDSELNEAPVESEKPIPLTQPKAVAKPVACEQLDCLCKCIKDVSKAAMTSLKPSFKGTMVGSACVCPCKAPVPTAAELMKANPLSGAR